MKMQNYKADDTIGKGEGVLVKREIANRDKELHIFSSSILGFGKIFKIKSRG